jgi:hypothetical protein
MIDTDLRQPIGTAMLYMHSRLAEDDHSAFDEWCDRHHAEFLANVAGALSVRRFEVTASPFSKPDGALPLLTVYQLAGPTALDGDDYRRHSEIATPMPDGVATITAFRRAIYRQITPASGSVTATGIDPVDAGQRIGTAIVEVTADVDPDWDDEANSWYDEEHLPAVVGAPGVLSARRFIDRDAPAAPGSRQSDDHPRYLTVYELEDVAVLSEPAFAAAGAPTERRTALGDHFRARMQVYRQVFPASGPLVPLGG